MALGIEMMIDAAMKAAGIDKEMLIGRANEIQAMVLTGAQTLARIEQAVNRIEQKIDALDKDAVRLPDDQLLPRFAAGAMEELGNAEGNTEQR